ncbi:MAG: amino acid permease [Cyanothece sp. SIO1E1]|nr:amino acid permease [Cyanothece sp. SIO1E1]
MSQLNKRINLYGLTMIAVGSCIGAGIFTTPNVVAQPLNNHLLVLIIWIVGGLISLTGALTFAELGGMFPQSGGVYVFLKEAYGEITGFLYGWVILLAINTGSLAALGIALAEYLTFFFPMSPEIKTLVAVGVIAGLTLINVVGVQVSQSLANVFTGLKLLAIVGIVIVGVAYYDPAKVDFSLGLVTQEGQNIYTGLLIALIGVLWSYGGWHHASYVAGETINAQKTVPRAMMLGAVIVTLTYVLVNLAYMLLLPMDALVASEKVAGDAVAAVLSNGGQFVAIAIAISIFGTISIYTMSAPRIYFAMAKDGLFFQKMAEIHPRFRTPTNAMLIQALWAILLLLFWGTFADLITYVVFMDFLFMALGAYSVILFRKRMADRERPYKTWGYPIVPWIFIVIVVAFLINTLISRPSQAIAGILIAGVGIAVFSLFKKKDTTE